MDNLAGWRRQLDQIDSQIIVLLAQRFKITDQIGQYKTRHGIEFYDPHREAEILAHLTDLAQSQQLNPQLVEAIYQQILKFSKLSRSQA